MRPGKGLRHNRSRRRSEEAQAEGLQAQLQMALQLEEAAAQEAEQRLQGLAKAEASLQETWEEELLISRRSCEGLVGSNSDLEVQVRSLQEACEEAHSRAVDLGTLETSLRHKVQQLEEEVAESKGARASDQLAIAALQHQVLALESEVGSRQCALETEALAEAEAAEMAKALKAQLQGLEAEHAGLQHALERQSEMEVELHAKAANLKSALEESDGRGQKLEDAGKALEQEVGRLEEELATNRLSSDEDQRRVHALQDQIALLKVEMAARDTSQEMQISTEAELQKQLFEAKARLEAVSLTEGMQQELIARLQGSLNSFETDLSQSRTDLVAQESLRTRLQERFGDSAGRLRAEGEVGLRAPLAADQLRGRAERGEHLLPHPGAHGSPAAQPAGRARGLGLPVQVRSEDAGVCGQPPGGEAHGGHLGAGHRALGDHLPGAEGQAGQLRPGLLPCQAHGGGSGGAAAILRGECDLQQQLAMVDASLAAALSTNEDQSAAHARLEEGYEQLKSELAAATETGEHHHKSKSQLQDQVAELQGEVAEMHLSCQAKSRQEAELQQRLQRSEAELSMAQSGAKAQQDVASDLKQSLDDVKRELAVRVKEAQEKQDQVSCLQRDGQKAQSKLAEVSKELAGAETRVESFYERCAQQEVRCLTKAQGELASARREGESLQGLEADLKSSLAKKEAVLMGALATSETHRANEAALRIALQKQERLLADERVAKDSAERQLLQSSAGVAGLRQELAEATAQRDEHASFGQNLQSKFQHLEAKSEARLEEAAQSESALREKLQEDFWGKLNAKPKLQDTNQLNGPRSHFQEKARDARRRVVAVLRRAGDLHHATIELEISRLLQQRGRMFEPTAADAGEAMMQTMMQRLSTRRWRLAQELEGIQEQVKDAIRLNEGTTEGSDEDQLVAERLELDAQLISQDVALLRAHAVLDDVPWAVVKALATASGIILPEDGKEEKYPLHWAAAHGRRDVVEFLLRYPAEDLLNQRDDQGRTPLFYAERAGNDALALYLRERGSDINPQEPIHVRPSGASIPDAYADVIKVVEERGWHAVKWIEGFTLLHWAAERNLADFCRYFVALNADPNAIDSRGRTALKCAMDTNSRDAEMALRELMGLGSPFPAEPTTGMFPQEPVSRSELSRSNLAPSPTDSGGIPEAYIRVMKQIDQIGWEKMCWARGFTLLHWAAKHDRADLCELFLWHGAEVNHRDDSGRSAMDYAQLRQPPALAALEVMQRGKPNHKPVVMLPEA
ncbi:unnamed protein product [Effrenium voratum]|uniref:Uncharacterized protein n=1 Tax=Effrenium voratum TaxID=2562239 RepID=A0AA36MV26_9DINO|nr:unnamed protein product [Effrenium voratum]